MRPPPPTSRPGAPAMTPRIRCRAVFLDAGGVIVLPHRDLVAGALFRVGLPIDPNVVAHAHYRALRAFDRAGASNPTYRRAFCTELGIAAGRTEDALEALAELADRRRSGEIMWSEPTPGAFATIAALRRRGLPVVIVTNSDGHAEENLRDCGIPDDIPVIDSEVVGSDKPDAGIFEAALHRAGAGIRATDVVHVGDTLSADVAGARDAGITPIHFDPLRACRARDHRHIRTLAGIWRHVIADTQGLGKKL
jgi:putative hydrolase of the HAD superfamily